MSTASIYRSAEGQRMIMALYDRALQKWPVPFAEMDVETRHGTTHVIASGEISAPPLVLLHGACSNAVSWLGDVAELSRCCRVFSVDILGEPGKSSANRPPWQGPAYAEWLEDVLDALAIDKASLLGISQGGWTALKFATRKPERVERLILLTPGGIVTPRPWFVLRAVVLSLFGRRGAEAINRIVFGRQPIHEDAVKFMNEIMTHFKARIGAQPLFTDEELARLTMPTLLIVGALDPIAPTEKTVARMKRLVPNLTIVTQPELGHMLHGQTAEIVPFLAAPRST